MDEPTREPFWKRKRWIALAVLWLAFSYVASAGPVCYLYGRGVFRGQPEDIYMPLCHFGPFFE